MSLPERRALLTAALGFAQLTWHSDPPPAVNALRAYMNSWRGLGDVVVGMMRQDFEVDVSGGPDGWTATFLRGREGAERWRSSAWRTMRRRGRRCSGRRRWR
jgi:hypothetical protein